MKTVSMLEFRRDAEKIIRQVQKGQPMILLYRGQPAIRLEPVREGIREDDPIYALSQYAEDGESLDNEEIDRILYGK